MRRLAAVLTLWLGVALPTTLGWAQSDSDSLPAPEDVSDSESESGSEGPPQPEAPSGAEDSDGSGSEAERSNRSSSSTNECSYHVDCPSDHLCVRGECVRSKNAVEQMSADEACGGDRRCRIERLKRRNRARRQAQLLEEEREVRSMVERYRGEEIAQYPRIDRPFTADLRMSRFGVLGLAAGYTFFGRLRPELHFAHKPAYDVFVEVDNRDFDGTQSVTWFVPGIVYFFTDGSFAPYAGVSFLFGTGSYEEFGGDIGGGFEGGGTNSPSRSASEIDTEYHAAEIKAGVDYQMKDMGGHLRFGLAYRPLIYNQARFGPGDYSDATRRAMDKWFGNLAQIDVMFLAGWAF